ncbi:MAG: hypothetical protein ACOX5Q_10375 [Bacillota bacterium]|jgi:hypothetical protein|nr:hypothetical protein [Candidatus Fermentithermobacillaceae bacterium]
MKKWLLFLVGFIPLALGYVMNHAMMAFPSVALPYGTIGIVFLIAWFGLGMATRRLLDSDRKALAIVHVAGFVALLLLLYQEAIQGYYWANQVGTATQFFYLPVLNVAGKFTAFSPRLYWTYILGFALMTVAFALGRSVGKRAA